MALALSIFQIFLGAFVIGYSIGFLQISANWDR